MCIFNLKEKIKEGNVLFNYALNTLLFTVRLYGVGYTVHDNETAREKTRCHHYMGYSFRLAARNLLYAPSHKQNNTHCYYTSCGALTGMRNSSMGPP